MLQDKGKHFLHLKCKTWTRDSHGLFDYESKTIKENELIIEGNSQLIRRKHHIIDRNQLSVESMDTDEQVVCQVSNESSKHN